MSANAINIQYTGNIGWTESSPIYQTDPFYNLTSPYLGYKFPSSNYIKMQPRKVTYSANALGNTTHIYTSPAYADMTSLARYFGDWGCAYEIQEGAIHTFTVNCPWDTMTSQDFNVSLFASENWELTPVMDTQPLLSKGLLTGSYYNGYVYQVLPDIFKVAVQRALDNKSDFVTGLSSGSAYSSSYATFLPLMQKTLNYLRGGIEGVPAFSQVLKRTAVIDKRNSNKAFQTAADISRNSVNSQGSINFIYSSQALINTYAIPYDTVGSFMLPSYTKPISISGVDAMTINTYAGWLVKPPSSQFISRNKVQLTQEFVWNEYADGLYYKSGGSVFPPIGGAIY